MLKKSLIKIFTLLLITIMLSACTTNHIASVITDDNYSVLCTPLKLKTDEILMVELPSSRFSGYKWEIENGATTVLQLMNKKIARDLSHTEGGIHHQNTIWQFKAYAPGDAMLAFIYKLEWDTKVPDTQRIACPVTVSNE